VSDPVKRPPISELFISLTASLEQVIATIDRSARISLALIVDDEGLLVNTISDGDVRRGLLAGLRLSDPASALLPIKARTPHPDACTAPVGTDRKLLLEYMQGRGVRQIPLVDKNGRPVDIVILADLLPEVILPLQAMVMAGGQGSRLRPLTEDMPKPMLSVGGKPLMEHIIGQLRNTGIQQINIATHYHADKIIDHFGDGGAFGVSIRYVQEEAPLGTGGALGLMERPTNPLLVINGDILTDIDYRNMFEFHREHKAELTVAVCRYELQVPYGVIECDGGAKVRRLREKPDVKLFVNAGIYLLEPSVYEHLSPGEHMNMTELINRLLNSGRPVVSFPICEYWLDVGQHDHYIQAQEDFRNGKLKSAAAAPSTSA
jgi:dTDP-glucose pyrophosphorylase/CBS domain-containing protein